MVKIQEKKTQMQAKKQKEKIRKDKTDAAKQKKIDFEYSIQNRAKRVDQLSMPKAPGTDVTDEAMSLYEEQNIDAVRPTR